VRECMNRFETCQGVWIGSGLDPSDSKSGSQYLRKRRAQEHDSLSVECLRWFRSNRTERQVTVNIVFDQRHIVFDEQLSETFLVILVKDESKRVMAVRNTDAASHAMLPDSSGKRVQIHRSE